MSERTDALPSGYGNRYPWVMRPSAMVVVTENMRRVRRGEAPRDAVDPKVGY